MACISVAIVKMPNMTNLARRGTPLVLAGWFVIASTAIVAGRLLLGGPFWFGSEAVVGTHAARALLAGGNPWTADFLGTVFTAPPPALLPYLAFAWLPDEIVAAAWVAIGIGSSIYAMRRLGLPVWYLFFPPIVAGVMSGSPLPLTLALLLRAADADDRRSVLAGAAAVVLQPFAAIPALLLGRWRAALLGLDIALLTVPFLGWAAFLGNLPSISTAWATQTNGGLSAAVGVGLVLVTALALALIGRRRAAWLILPALMPNSTLAVAALALPVLAEMPLVAAALASPATPGLIAYGIATQSAVEGLRLRRRRPAFRRWAPDELVAHHERRARQGAAERPVSAERG
jgi:hypothetical protein